MIKVQEQDPLHNRRTWILGQLLDELEPTGVSVVAPEASIDTTTPAGRAMREVLATFVQLDRGQTIEKMARGAHNSALRGGWPAWVVQLDR